MKQHLGETKHAARLRLGIFLGGIGLLCSGALAFGCATERPDDSNVLRDKGQAQTLGSVGAPQAAFDAGALLFGAEWVKVGDRARIGADSARAAVASTGSGTMLIGTDSKVGAIWSKGLVDLRDRALVAGSITTETGVSQGNQVQISGPTVVGPLGPKFPVNATLPSFGSTGGPVSLEPGQTLTLAPGKYLGLLVKANARLKLQKGDYQFTTMTFDTGSKLEVTESCEAVRVFVLTSLLFRGQVVQPSAVPVGLALALSYVGTNTAHIETPFKGDVLAPNAELIISSATHYGHFLGKKLRVQPDARVLAPGRPEDRPASCAPEPAVPPEFEPVALGPVPVLEHPSDLPAFLHWYYRMRQEHSELFAGVMFQIQGNGPITSAVIDELEAMRDGAEFGPALMLVHLVGAIGASNGNQYLFDLLDEPIPATPDVPDVESDSSRSAYSMEVAIRRAAIQVSARDLTPSRETHLRQLMTQHPERTLRAAAIRALSRDMSEAERDVLRTQILPEDEPSLDRISPNDPDVATKLAAFMQKYEVL